LAFGVVGTALLLPGRVYIGSVGVDIHTFIVACILILLGLQSVGFAFVARRYGLRNGFIPGSARYTSILEALTLERLLVAALCLFVLGAVGVGWCVWVWASAGFGPLEYATVLRLLVLSLTAIAAGIQLAFTAFLAGIMDIPTRR
jgi:hypothetical protein